jgi:hypothetical protein
MRGAIGWGSLNPVNKRTFVVALKCRKLRPALCGQVMQALIDTVKRGVTINFWLAGTKQIQIRAVQYENMCGHWAATAFI